MSERRTNFFKMAKGYDAVHMFVKLFLLFTIVPCVELGLLIKVGQMVGVMETVMLIVITGVVAFLGFLLLTVWEAFAA